MSVTIVTGAGGVGKTTIAAALAVASARSGARTLVLTIDPARRLADALGLHQLGNEPEPTPEPNLSAAMLDAEASWEDVVHRTAPAEEAGRLVASPFFDAIARRFPAGQAFAAGDQLLAQLESGEWDQIIVDTPPADGGLDFFLAPGRMRTLVGGRVLRWMTGAGLPGRRRLYRLTAAPFFRIADTVLGSRLLEQVAEFLLDLRSAYDGLAKRAAQVERRLERSRVVVVTTARTVPMAEAARFFEHLEDIRIRPGVVVFNRSLPAGWAEEFEDHEHPLVRAWASEAAHQRTQRAEFAAQHEAALATIPLVSPAPTGLDALAELIADQPRLQDIITG